MHRRGRGQHVAGVAERGDVAQGGHVSGEGGRVEGAALGEVLQRVVHLFALFGFARHFSVSGLDAFLLHSQGSVNLNKDQFFFFFYFFAAFEMAQAFAQGHRFHWLPQVRGSVSVWGPFQGPKVPQSRCQGEGLLTVVSSYGFQKPETTGEVLQAQLIN